MAYNEPMKLIDFVNSMLDVLNIRDFDSADSSLNGLQVGDLDSEIRKVAFSVDASLATIRAASEAGADLLFVHHGLFWGRPKAITGTHYDRVKALLDNGVGLFACHLPLDAHMKMGNNARMAQTLDMTDVEPFSLYKGKYIGVKGRFPKPMTAGDIIKKLGIRENATDYIINGGEKTFRTAGIVSGGGAFDVYEAMDEGLDVLITGESQYSTVNDCAEAGMSMLCLGHYETETFGVKAVMEYVSANMGLETCFIDMPLGL